MTHMASNPIICHMNPINTQFCAKMTLVPEISETFFLSPQKEKIIVWPRKTKLRVWIMQVSLFLSACFTVYLSID